jgi:hypothetical protein
MYHDTCCAPTDTVGNGGIIRESLKLRKKKDFEESRLYIHEEF